MLPSNLGEQRHLGEQCQHLEYLGRFSSFSLKCCILHDMMCTCIVTDMLHYCSVPLPGLCLAAMLVQLCRSPEPKRQAGLVVYRAVWPWRAEGGIEQEETNKTNISSGYRRWRLQAEGNDLRRTHLSRYNNITATIGSKPAHIPPPSRIRRLYTGQRAILASYQCGESFGTRVSITVSPSSTGSSNPLQYMSKISCVISYALSALIPASRLWRIRCQSVALSGALR